MYGLLVIFVVFLLLDIDMAVLRHAEIGHRGWQAWAEMRRQSRQTPIGIVAHRVSWRLRDVAVDGASQILLEIVVGVQASKRLGILGGLRLILS